ncbi:hypothetical protein DFJ77DRAFT_476804 [Powellomyces hirtus]|nr:hypothetical protein DFJ77DRAFT_476804 [Powellomyces hirtus]
MKISPIRPSQEMTDGTQPALTYALSTLVHDHLHPQHVKDFHERGYLILEDVLSSTELEALRFESDALFNECEQDVVNELGCIIEPLHHPSYLERTHYATYRLVRSNVSDSADIVCATVWRIAELAKSVLPDEFPLHLFNEQYILKPPFQGDGTAFQWHQDSEYINATSRTTPTVACWVALDDVNEENGTLRIAPYPSSSASPTDHVYGSSSEYTRSHVERTSKYPKNQNGERAASAEEVIVGARAGTLVLMSGYVRHCSSPNRGRSFRRAFMPQFSVGPVLVKRRNTTAPTPLALAVPLPATRACLS